jgi:hypothetical protein
MGWGSEMKDDDDSRWHLDKKVPIALIATIFLQTVGFAWWVGGLSQRIDFLERSAAAAVPRLESVIRLETKVDAVNATLQELKALVNRHP